LFQYQIVSLLNGEKLIEGGEAEVDTVNALGKVNGRQVLASVHQVAQLKEHIRSYSVSSDMTDLRTKIRQVEALLLHKHAGYLIGNQCVDFQKQDGVTEIEEAIMANTVERRLNDLLWQQEQQGHVRVHRAPVYVSAVSNFTNFLDLSRKTLRSLEMGVPVIVLGRSHTAQHSYRWTQLLVDLCADAGIEAGMITFLSCSLEDIKDITQSCQQYTGNLYTTCSRSLAAEIKSSYPKTIASTGGPNTLVCLDWEDATTNANQAAAIACSASIESAGQCTALRHCVLPTKVSDADCLRIFDTVAHVDSAESALSDAVFAGIFAHHPATSEPSHTDYQKHESVDAFVKIRHGELPESGIHEFWRKVVVDFSKIDLATVNSDTGKRQIDEGQLNRLAAWLNENQPISLAVNGPRQEAISLGLKLWEQTALVVNTIGSSDDMEAMPPALTCQARPQEAEVFGEFPPRSSMHQYTMFPVVVPSSNPSYDAVYTTDYLRSRGTALSEYMGKSTRALLDEVKEETIRGYCVLLIEHLQNVTRLNPKPGFGTSRTALWGITRPPLGKKTVLRCHGGTAAATTWDAVAPIYVLFHVTNARNQVELSVDPQNTALVTLCDQHQLAHVVVESESDLTERLARGDGGDVFHLVRVSQPPAAWPMVGNFVSLYLPLCHIKSTMAHDEEFVLKARISEKWLNTLF
jgi:hypothetical protein